MHERHRDLTSSHPQNNLVLLHGMFGNSGHWTACASRFSPSWNVLNHGLPLLEVEPDMQAIVALGDHVVREMDAAGMERAVVGGNSLGGHIAARMALCHPDRVAGLILTGSSGLFERGFATVPRRPTETWIRAKMREVFHDPVHITDELVNEMRTFMSSIRRVIHMIRIARCAKRDSLRELLPSITCPVLLIWGKNDDVTPPSVAREFHELLPNSQLHLLDECGHAPMIEQPGIFNDLAASFLSGMKCVRARPAAAMFAAPAASLEPAPA